MRLRSYRAVVVAAVLMISSVSTSIAQEESEPQLRQRTRATTDATSSTETDPTKATDEEKTKEDTRRGLSSSSGLELPGAVDPDQYRLGPGDVLQISVWGGITRTVTLEVGPEGTVLLPSAGTIKIDGLPLRQARNDILARLRPEFRGVNLDVRLLRPRRFLVYVTGQVQNPGGFPATGASRVADVVLLSEPFKDASLRQIDVIHRDGTREIADLDLFLRTASQSLNPWLRDGDVLNVPLASSFIHIQGAISRPGRYELGSRDSLRTLLMLGGGLVPAADTTRALFVRWVDVTRLESLWVNVGDIQSGAVNPPLRHADHFYVYFIPEYALMNEATALGAVKRPGIYPIKVGRDRISNVVNAAGGFLTDADLASIRVRRANLRTGEDPELERLLRLSRNDLTNSEYEVLQTKLAGLREEYRIDWNRLQNDADLDVLLVGGDVIEVDRVVNSIRVDGQVRRPGILSYRPGLELSDYIRAAGGFSERAWRSKVRVTRSVTGQTFLAKDVTQFDPGDLIWVPEKADVTFWGQMQTVLAAAAQVATVILAFSSVNR